MLTKVPVETLSIYLIHLIYISICLTRYLEGVLGAEAAKLSNQARFILEKCSNQLVIENKKKKVSGAGCGLCACVCVSESVCV